MQAIVNHIVTLGLLVIFTASALSQDTWVKVFGGSSREYINGFAADGDGGYLVWGDGWSEDGDFGSNRWIGPCNQTFMRQSFYFAKVDAAGNVAWRIVYGHHGNRANINYLGTTSDSGAIFVGTAFYNHQLYAKYNLKTFHCNPFIADSRGQEDVVIMKISKRGEVQWTRNIGGSNDDWVLLSTSNSGFRRSSCALLPNDQVIITGHTSSNDGDFNSMIKGGCDVFVASLNSSGQMLWRKTFGGTDFETVESAALEDGNVVLTGRTSSRDGDFRRRRTTSDTDTFKLRLDMNGNVLSKWHPRIDEARYPSDWSVYDKLTMKDGASIFLTDTAYGPGTYSSDWKRHAVVMQFDSARVMKARNVIRGSGDDIGVTTLQAESGEYYVVGTTSSDDGDFSGLRKSGVDFSGNPTTDVFVAKYDHNNRRIFLRKYGGSNTDAISTVVQTREGDLLLIGSTMSDDGVFERATRDESDIYVLKIDSAGQILWIRTYGGRGLDEPVTGRVTPDNGIMILGTTTSDVGDQFNDGDFNGLGKGQSDIFIMKLDANGNLKPTVSGSKTK